MVQQFSLPQKRVLEELDGERCGRLTDWPAPGSPCSGLPWETPLIPLSWAPPGHTLEEAGAGPSRGAQ